MVKNNENGTLIQEKNVINSPLRILKDHLNRNVLGDVSARFLT